MSTTTTKTTSQHEKSSYSLWLSKQPLPVVAAVETVKGTLGGAVCGALLGSAFKTTFPGGPMIIARNYAAMMGVFEGTLSVMKRIRGKEDIQSRVLVAGFDNSVMHYAALPLSNAFNGAEFIVAHGGIDMASAFGAGAVYSLVRGKGGIRLVTTGLTLALGMGAICKVEELLEAHKQRKEGLKDEA